MIVTVPVESDGVRLDRFLASVVGDRSRSYLQKLIKDGLVSIDGHAVKPNHAVRAGERVDLRIPEAVDASPRPEALPLRVVYEDGDLIVVDKPAGMVVHP